MKIQILISKNSWAMNYKKDLKKKLGKYTKKIIFLNNHKKLKNKQDINIIFSYFKIIDKKSLKKSKYNLVPHEADLPKGRGMSPLSWQILKNKNLITFSLIEAAQKMDAGRIYFKNKVTLRKDIVFDEIKQIQFNQNIKLILKFIKFYKKNKKAPKSEVQTGKATYYKLRKKNDSKVDISKSLKSQFNLLRISDFKNYPNFFFFNKKKFFIKIIKEKK